MRIHVGEDREIVFSEVFNGVGIQTDQGLFGIAQRDAGIEVLLDGVLVFSSSSDTELDRLRARAKLCDEILRELGERWRDVDLPEHFARVVQERNERLNPPEMQALFVLVGLGWEDAFDDFAVDQGWTDDESARFVAKLRRLGLVS